MVKRLGGECWYVERGTRPTWFDYATRYNQASKEEQITMRLLAKNQATDNIFNRNVHSSEWAWIGHGFDNELDNNSDIPALFDKVEDALKIWC